VAAVGIGFFQLGRPAMTWMNEAPQHMTELRQRVQRIVPGAARFSQAAAAVNNLGATEEEQRRSPTVEIRTSRFPSLFDWTGTFLVGVGETLVLLYLILASGDLFLQKLVRVMPTMGDKRRAVEISHEIQQKISNYFFSVSLINLGLGILVSGSLYWLGVPNAAMWGMLVAALNFIPYFGPVAGIILLGAVGLLTFDAFWKAILPSAWYLLLHLLEANFITPMLLGRRFTLNPVVIFVFLIFWTWLWGVPGALLSVPILVSIKVVCDHVPTLSSVSALLTS
jgi:predicted PurR-regulated permease PerM